MTTIKLKNGSGAPTAGDLVQGEPALDLTNKRLYTEDSVGTVIEVGTNPTSVTTGAITATGIDVTGTVTADGLTVDGVVSVDGNVGIDTNHVFGQGLGYGGNTTSAGAGTLTLYDATTGAAVIDGFGPSYLADSGVVLKQSGVKGFHLKNNNDIEFYEDTGTTAKLFWDASAESLGIGHSNPSYKLDVRDSSSFLLFASTDATTGSLARIRANGGSTEVLEIQASGNVGIGTSSPSGSLHVQSASSGGSASAGGDELILESSATTGLTILSGTANDGNILFGDSGNAAIGYLQYKHADNALVFGANNAERMRIDSSGNLLVGTTDTAIYDNSAGSSADNGFVYDASASRLDVTRYTTSTSSAVALLNKTGADGAILELRKAGSPVGSIAIISSTLHVGTTNCRLRFNSTASDIRPVYSTGLNYDAAIDLGDSAARFKDLYLSGGVYLGGTGTANKLDDYEEGTFTPVITGTTGTPTVTYYTQSGVYTKIGRTVYYRIGFRVNTISGGSGVLRFSGLPFTAKAYGAYENPFSFVNNGVLTSSQSGPFLMFVESGSTTMQGRYANTNADNGFPLGLIQAGSYMLAEGFYEIA